MKPSRSQTLRLIVAPSFKYQQQASEKTLDIVSDQLLIVQEEFQILIHLTLIKLV
jgi:hypothetical protein